MEVRIREFAVRLSLGVSATTPIKAYQHGCLSLNQTRAAVIGMSKRTGESLWGLGSIQRSTGVRGMLRVGDNRLPQGRAHQLVIHLQRVS